MDPTHTPLESSKHQGSAMRKHQSLIVEFSKQHQQSQSRDIGLNETHSIINSRLGGKSNMTPNMVSPKTESDVLLKSIVDDTQHIRVSQEMERILSKENIDDLVNDLRLGSSQ